MQYRNQEERARTEMKVGGAEMDLVKEKGISERDVGVPGRNLARNFGVRLRRGVRNFGVGFRVFGSEFSAECRSRIMEWVAEFRSRTLEYGTELERNFGVEIWYMTCAAKGHLLFVSLSSSSHPSLRPIISLFAMCFQCKLKRLPLRTLIFCIASVA